VIRTELLVLHAHCLVRLGMDMCEEVKLGEWVRGSVGGNAPCSNNSRHDWLWCFLCQYWYNPFLLSVPSSGPFDQSEGLVWDHAVKYVMAKWQQLHFRGQ
jgi:hypothetical protein